MMRTLNFCQMKTGSDDISSWEETAPSGGRKQLQQELHNMNKCFSRDLWGEKAPQVDFMCLWWSCLTHQTVIDWCCRKYEHENVFTCQSFHWKLSAWSDTCGANPASVSLISKQGVCNIKTANENHLPWQSKASCWVVTTLLSHHYLMIIMTQHVEPQTTQVTNSCSTFICNVQIVYKNTNSRVHICWSHRK